MLNELDLSRIQHLFLKENYLLGLGLPAGYLFFRIRRREFFIYLYDELDSMAADAYNSEVEYTISARNVENAFRIPTDRNHILQIFRGICPSALRTYLGVPFTTPQQHLDMAARVQKSDWGYISGFESPLNYPCPETEVWIPYKLDIGFATYNALSDTIAPLIKFPIMRYDAKLITDVDLIMRILERKVECRLATVGGLSDYDYHYQEYYSMDAIDLGDSRETVQKKLARA